MVPTIQEGRQPVLSLVSSMTVHLEAFIEHLLCACVFLHSGDLAVDATDMVPTLWSLLRVAGWIQWWQVSWGRSRMKTEHGEGVS
jgi:hypothetical protein